MEIFTQGKTNQPVQQIVQIEPNPVFDDYRQFSPEGREFWSARDLQKVLEYSRWEKFEKAVLSVKEELEFEGTDLSANFHFTSRGSQSGKNTLKQISDYNLSRFFCYKLAMRGETDACKRSRTYFAVQTRKQEVQEQPKPTLAINADFLEQVAKKMRELEEAKQRVIEETKPAVEFTHQVQNSINSVTVADFAKAMGSGEIRFYAWLRESGYLMNSPKNRPYQNYIDSGYFKVIEKTFTDQSTGETRTYFQTLITGKGQTYLAARWGKQQLALN